MAILAVFPVFSFLHKHTKNAVLQDFKQALRTCSKSRLATYSHPPKVSDKARRRRQYAVVRRGFP